MNRVTVLPVPWVGATMNNLSQRKLSRNLITTSVVLGIAIAGLVVFAFSNWKRSGPPPHQEHAVSVPSRQNPPPLPPKPAKWSWDLIRNGMVWSYTEQKWVKYPSMTGGDGWWLEANLNNFHKIHGLPPIDWRGHEAEYPTNEFKKSSARPVVPAKDVEPPR